MAHNTCRHVSEAITNKIIQAISSKRNGSNSQLYQASYTTVQEEEADRVSLLYMALAGFDPQVASSIWERANQTQGNNPSGGYFYNHPLNSDRAHMMASLGVIASRYYNGNGIENPDYAELKLKNDLVRNVSTKSNNGLVATAEAAAGIYMDRLKTRAEVLQRQAKMMDPAVNTKIIFSVNKRLFGQSTIDGRLQNIGGGTLQDADLLVSYYDANGGVIYNQPVSLGAMALPYGEIKDWSVPLLNVKNMQGVSVIVARINMTPQ
jgi:hypothetical protein